MRIIKIEAEANNCHAYQTINYISTIPQGWAIVPEEMETPNFPYGEIEVEEIYGVVTVTKWIAGVVPEVPKVEPEPTAEEMLNAMVGGMTCE